MQVWSRFKIEHISDLYTDTDELTYSNRKVVLSNVGSGDGNNSGDIKIEMSIKNMDKYMLSQLFDKRISEEVEVRFTTGDMLKEIEEEKSK